MMTTDTPLVLACGTRMLVGALKIGDYLVGPNGKPQEITYIAFSKQPCVKVRHEAQNGWFVCDETHTVFVRTSNQNKSNGMAPKPIKLLQEGMKLIVESDEKISRLKNIFFSGERLVAKIICAPDHMYYADGVLHKDDLCL